MQSSDVVKILATFCRGHNRSLKSTHLLWRLCFRRTVSVWPVLMWWMWMQFLGTLKCAVPQINRNLNRVWVV